MSVHYPKEMRQYAKDRGLHLVTIAVPGVQFQGPAEKAFADSLLEFLTAHLKQRKRRKTLRGKA